MTNYYDCVVFGSIHNKNLQAGFRFNCYLTIICKNLLVVQNGCNFFKTRDHLWTRLFDQE